MPVDVIQEGHSPFSPLVLPNGSSINSLYSLVFLFGYHITTLSLTINLDSYQYE